MVDGGEARSSEDEYASDVWRTRQCTRVGRTPRSPRGAQQERLDRDSGRATPAQPPPSLPLFSSSTSSLLSRITPWTAGQSFNLESPVSTLARPPTSSRGASSRASRQPGRGSGRLLLTKSPNCLKVGLCLHFPRWLRKSLCVDVELMVHSSCRI